VQSAARLCAADNALIDQKADDRLEQLASFGFAEDFARVAERNRPIVPDPRLRSSAARCSRPSSCRSWTSVPIAESGRSLKRRSGPGFRTVLAAPPDMRWQAERRPRPDADAIPSCSARRRPNWLRPSPTLAALLIANASLLECVARARQGGLVATRRIRHWPGIMIAAMGPMRQPRGTRPLCLVRRGQGPSTADIT